MISPNIRFVKTVGGRLSLTSIPEKVRLRLWGKAAGRCQYEGCNQPLWFDSLTQAEFNVAYIAHIVADRATGPRGDEALSPKLAADITNLMLLCDAHHRLVDKEQVEEHPVSRLVGMKRRHEERIDLLGSLTEEKQSHVLLFGANIGVHSAPLSFQKAAAAMTPQHYPAEARAIEIGLRNSGLTDHTPEYWQLERLHLETKVQQLLRPRLALGEIHHLSVFALAPQPLLVLLGSLLSDIPTTEVYQLHREPPTWEWQDGSVANIQDFALEEPSSDSGSDAALIFSLSATVDVGRIRSVLPKGAPWVLSIPEPHNDFLKTRSQLTKFREILRHALDRIKARHGQSSGIHIFPAMPVALAVELGRIRMPKADLPLIMYDENRAAGGFQSSLTVS